MLRQRLTRFHRVLILATVCLLCIVGLTQGASRLLGMAVVFSVTSVVMALGVSRPHWRFFGQSLCRVATRRKQVALTFDDGPDPESTPALLFLLERKGIRATFFCVGERVAAYSAIAARMAAEGHQLENHSLRHSGFTNFLSVDRLRAEVRQTQETIARVAGRTPQYFRPPMGLTNFRVFRVAADLGLRVTAWSARGRDQSETNPSEVVARLLRGLGPGAILLLHDGGVPANRLISVVELLVDKLHAADYQCVRLDELVGAAEPE